MKLSKGRVAIRIFRTETELQSIRTGTTSLQTVIILTHKHIPPLKAYWSMAESTKIRTFRIPSLPPRASIARDEDEGYPGKWTAKVSALGRYPEMVPSFITPITTNGKICTNESFHEHDETYFLHNWAQGMKKPQRIHKFHYMVKNRRFTDLSSAPKP